MDKKEILLRVKELEARLEENNVELNSVNKELTEKIHELNWLTNRDSLTGLFNRRRFEEEVKRELASSLRYHIPGALLWLDLDQFKQVNDSFGHRIGDEFLVDIGRRLQENIQETDTVARVSGDEFIILLPHTNAKEAQATAARLLDSIRQFSVFIKNKSISLTASIGIVTFPEDGRTFEELFTCLDYALARAKEEGRNRFKLYTATDKAGEKQFKFRLNRAAYIRAAFKNNLFVLFGQPILDLKEEKIAQYELLIRIKDKTGRLILPGLFLGAAERFGLMYDIDCWVVEQVFQLLSNECLKGRDLKLAINLSGQAFVDDKVLSLIKKKLSSSRINPANLILEVTETVISRNIYRAMELISVLTALGCQFALDDFGVGFSSLHQLKHLPADYLKIYGSFIRNLKNDIVDQKLVQSIIQVGQALNKKIIAEWVEDKETLDLVRTYGAEYAQGYYIARPRPIDEILAGI